MKITELYPGVRVAISGPGITLEGRVEGVYYVGSPEQTRITVWGQLGGMIIIPADMAHLVTIRDLDEMEPPC